MKRNFWCGLIMVASCYLFITACGDQPSRSIFLETEEASGIPDPPDAFADLINPFAGDQGAASEGEILYQANCSSCHGLTGEGDGAASGGLDPKPQNLAERQSELSDSYLFWRISDGGLIEPFNSIMPAWRGL